MIIYNIEKKKYEESLKDGSAYYPPPSVQTPIVGHGIEQDFDDDATDIVSSPEEPKKRRRRLKRKKRKRSLAMVLHEICFDNHFFFWNLILLSICIS